LSADIRLNNNSAATFADGQLTEALKHLATDASADAKVRKKVIAVLASWHSQFKSDPSMTVVAGLLHECRTAERSVTETTQNLSSMGIVDTTEADRKKAEREEAKKAKREKEKAKREEEKAKRDEERKRREREVAGKRPPFVFAKVSIKTLIDHTVIQLVGSGEAPSLECHRECFPSLQQPCQRHHSIYNPLLSN
jgi:hypothetical protein